MTNPSDGAASTPNLKSMCETTPETAQSDKVRTERKHKVQIEKIKRECITKARATGDK